MEKGQLAEEDLIAAFSKKLIVHLGKQDDDPNASGLRHNNVVDNQQGLNRYDRGQFFFNTSQATAQDLGAAFNWGKHEVSGVAHEAQLMANDALQYFLLVPVSTKSNKVESRIQFYPNPSSSGLLHFLNPSNSKLKIRVLNALGQAVYEVETQSNQLDVRGLGKGVFFIQCLGKENILSSQQIILQ